MTGGDGGRSGRCAHLNSRVAIRLVKSATDAPKAAGDAPAALGSSILFNRQAVVRPAASSGHASPQGQPHFHWMLLKIG